MRGGHFGPSAFPHTTHFPFSRALFSFLCRNYGVKCDDDGVVLWAPPPSCSHRGQDDPGSRTPYLSNGLRKRYTESCLNFSRYSALSPIYRLPPRSIPGKRRTSNTGPKYKLYKKRVINKRGI